MKTEGLLFAFLFTFLTICSVVYWILSQDPTGTTALVFSAGLALLVGFYLLFTARRIEPRPEDRADGEIIDGAGEVGFFSPHSWWPIALGAAATISGVGLVFGVWLALLGAGLVLLTACGLLFEYYVGHTQGAGAVAGSHAEQPSAGHPNVGLTERSKHHLGQGGH